MDRLINQFFGQSSLFWLFCSSPGSLREPHIRNPSHGKGTLWTYGDSLNYNNYRYNFLPSRLCKHMFEQCRYNINFVYHIKYRKELDTTETDDLDFNVTRVLHHFQSVLLDPDVNHVNSVIFLNLGLHYVMSLTFEHYQGLIGDVIKTIKETDAHGRRNFKGHVIWKTTTAVHKEKASDLQATKWRFCTYPVSIPAVNLVTLSVIACIGDTGKLCCSLPYMRPTHSRYLDHAVEHSDRLLVCW